ncbi:MAG: peptidoglycan DD-metalloendopeptidase family protein [Rikenellaceae bacterium]|jgi:murein DD-endopeptidase MepM/ murein hydrolase activator NlpD|nr:peptidoglycan DD-metalloendopeptidase family protein [Rikenellaceae bacterium]
MKMRLPLILLLALLSASICAARRRSRYIPSQETTETPAPAVDSSTVRPAPYVPPEPHVNGPTIIQRFAYSETQTIGSPGPKRDLVIPLGDAWPDFCYPCDGKLISDYGMRNGRMHAGVDIKAQPLDTIRAVGSGVVRMAKDYYGYGNMALVSHDNGLETLYAHNAKLLVAPNQTVRGGEAIALAGRTGRATTEHCHFEVRVDGKYFDPKLLLDPAARAIRPDTLRIAYNGGKVVALRGGTLQEGPPSPDDDGVEFDKPVAAVATAKPATSVGPAATGATYHTVRKGDTLYSLARRYGLALDELCRLNGITPSATIRIGQRLKVK